MAREVSVKGVAEFEMKRLRRLISNLLIDNVNFKTGYYFKEYPNSVSFQNQVVKPNVEHILEEFDKTAALLLEWIEDDQI